MLEFPDCWMGNSRTRDAEAGRSASDNQPLLAGRGFNSGNSGYQIRAGCKRSSSVSRRNISVLAVRIIGKP